MTARESHQENWQLYSKFVDEAVSKNNFAVAETLVELALKEAEYLGQSNEKYIGSLHRHAEILFKASKLEKSIEVYTNCLKSSLTFYGDRSLEVALVRCKLADVCISFGHHARAKDLFQSANTCFKANAREYSNYIELVEQRLEQIQKLQQKIQTAPIFYSDKTSEVRPLSVPSMSDMHEQRNRNFRLPQSIQIAESARSI